MAKGLVEMPNDIFNKGVFILQGRILRHEEASAGGHDCFREMSVAGSRQRLLAGDRQEVERKWAVNYGSTRGLRLINR